MTAKNPMEEKREDVLHICWKIFNHRQAAKERKGIARRDQECAAQFWLEELDRELNASK